MTVQDWHPLARELAKKAGQDESTLRFVRTAPSLLSGGASTLELARSASAPPKQVETVLSQLSSFDIVSSSTSGSSVPYGDKLYYLRGEGGPFFSYVNKLIQASS